jgi:hypothetical protein
MDPIVVINALGTWIGPSFGLAVVAFINWRAGRQAAKFAIATLQAQKEANEAAAKASVAAEQLIVSARNTDSMLVSIRDTGEKTHELTNSGNTVLLQLIEQLTARIARENPNDAQAQEDAEKARAASMAKQALDARVTKG